MLLLLGVIPLLANHYSLDGIKSRTVGDGQFRTPSTRCRTPGRGSVLRPSVQR